MKTPFGWLWVIALLAGAFPAGGAGGGLRTVHLIQDDAQDPMVSQVFSLRHLLTDDVSPFISGVVKRYNINSTVDSITSDPTQQLLLVACPVRMMPYVEDILKVLDRPCALAGHEPGMKIKNTGITRAVYTPRFRSSQAMMEIVTEIGFNASTSDSFVGYDRNSNQIYWKDTLANSEGMYWFFGLLDRPVPQANLRFTVYEVRESELRDLGLDYQAWKNGPGMNIFQAAFQAWSLDSAGSAALTAVSGTMGGLFFAPQFDASFIRMLAQTGHADVRAGANLTVCNGDGLTFGVDFNTADQNIVKTDNDRTSVTATDAPLHLELQAPVLSIRRKNDPRGELPYPYTLADFEDSTATMYFGYQISLDSVVERNNYGTELVDQSVLSGSRSLNLDTEHVLASWERRSRVEQTVGVPWLSRVPFLKYLFGTTTVSMERSRIFVTVQAQLVHPASCWPDAGKLLTFQRGNSNP